MTARAAAEEDPVPAISDISDINALGLRLAQLDSAALQSLADDADQAEKHRAFVERQLTPGTYALHGLTFECPGGVYQPDEFSSTRFMLRELVAAAPRYGEKVLDVGTGSGALGVTLASRGKRVTAVDIDPAAVACARDNAARNNVTATIFQSDLFDAVTGDFDLIAFNAPLRDGAIEHPVERIACDPGGAIVRRFLAEAPRHLAPGGCVAPLTASIGPRNALARGLAAYHQEVAAADWSASHGVVRQLLFLRPR